MASSKQIHRLATHPASYARFVCTGQLPKGIVPTGPLVDLLKAIGPGDRCRMTGLTVDHRLGYQGSRTFHTVEQAFRWVHPSSEVFGGFPADSWRIKRGNAPIGFETLVECCASVPSSVADRYKRLRLDGGRGLASSQGNGEGAIDRDVEDIGEQAQSAARSTPRP